mmetsp:Transcript_22135/g.46328  ORF Transcript_22135/g.46328 Transcript_22135/m.46328 type:complete len:422 (-) Transcript_22135:36-1301(-)
MICFSPLSSSSCSSSCSSTLAKRSSAALCSPRSVLHAVHECAVCGTSSPPCLLSLSSIRSFSSAHPSLQALPPKEAPPFHHLCPAAAAWFNFNAWWWFWLAVVDTHTRHTSSARLDPVHVDPDVQIERLHAEQVEGLPHEVRGLLVDLQADLLAALAVDLVQLQEAPRLGAHLVLLRLVVLELEEEAKVVLDQAHRGVEVDLLVEDDVEGLGYLRRLDLLQLLDDHAVAVHDGEGQRGVLEDGDVLEAHLRDVEGQHDVSLLRQALVFHVRHVVRVLPREALLDVVDLRGAHQVPRDGRHVYRERARVDQEGVHVRLEALDARETYPVVPVILDLQDPDFEARHEVLEGVDLLGPHVKLLLVLYVQNLPAKLLVSLVSLFNLTPAIPLHGRPVLLPEHLAGLLPREGVSSRHPFLRATLPP